MSVVKSLAILLVEDDLLTACDIQETLEKAGHRVTSIARTYQEALAAVKQQIPDLAIMDIRLEGSPADGIITAKEVIRIHPMPIIYLTASSEKETVDRARETLPLNYIIKPFRPAELPRQIEMAYHYYEQTRQTPGSTGMSSDSIFLPLNRGYQKVLRKDISLLCADGAYTRLILAHSDKTHLVSMNLGYLMQYFDTHPFFKISRSYIINLNEVERIEGNSVFITNYREAISIPEKMRALLLSRLNVIRTR
ncbi:response regulator [Arsenicibacter rosenii]|uniref:Response regulatory domain-containing protein n=1 Tax=Arsenicibacter rosenii TaxID=1750698 RepID=A0A1S2VF65_9BACT|nr:response regulator [Arsenicibacter rosenii]OIN57352.1 hypothetical protein BLX24_20465 [Arsenicibacter rosenii]